jgi:hypothetical protein
MFTLTDPPEILDYLAAPLRAMRDAFDDGASYASLTMEGRPRDPYLWAHLARYHAYHFLHDLVASAWTLSTLRNSGIQVAKGPLVVRAFKRLGGGPPHPGHSLARRDYYGQRLLPLLWEGVQAPESGANLLVDWDADPSTLQVSLALSKPEGVWRFQGKPKLEWRHYVDFADDGHPGFIPADEPLDDIDLDIDELGSPGDAG